MELSFERACGVAVAVLIAIWGGQKASDYVWPKHTAVLEKPVLVPEYELRRQRDEAWDDLHARWLI
ncbi:hypothetical protein FJ970_20950 [Mesorhizobium sp. B2-1-8]|uniref:hypothetical protein n=1 Tax=Mesorhizobium sp. B2-1-8 TaxID=2589967 RepID=UPI00112C247D|nr:hypothetical protein [Mesorhizobium sp. B2-1-8]UCI17568.1 hypothetical protein FJ970_20950 [Mesorhizobium sp. B2-1-8]